MTLNLVRKRRELLSSCHELAQQYLEWFSSDAEDLSRLVGGFEGKRVLDIGCGLNYPQVTIFQCLGAQATGIDIDIIEPGAKIASLLRLNKQLGMRKAFRDYFVAATVNKALSAEIAKAMNASRQLSAPDARFGDALNIDFEDNTFDLVYSHAVYEHIPDVGRGIDEIRRVLVPGGIARFAIHLYPSLTGAHTGKLGKPGHSVPPWDHLRERQVPPTSFLNELREADYRREIEGRLDIEKWTVSVREQDAQLLTEDIERELAATGYLRDELLSETLVVHAREC